MKISIASALFERLQEGHAGLNRWGVHGKKGGSQHKNGVKAEEERPKNASIIKVSEQEKMIFWTMLPNGNHVAK